MDNCWVRFLCVGLICLGLLGGIGDAHANKSDNRDLQPVLNVYLDTETKQLMDIQEKFTSAAVGKLKTFLTRSGLAYRLHYVPWPRALALLGEDNHSLIYQLLRTPPRVARYYWIMPVFEQSEMELFAREGTAYATQNLEQILAGDGRAACGRHSAQCGALRRLGFPKDRIEVVTYSATNVLERMLMRGRIQYIPGYRNGIYANLQNLGYKPESVRAIAFLDNSLDYLAAPMHFDPKLLSRLLHTSQDGLPKLTTEEK